LNDTLLPDPFEGNNRKHYFECQTNSATGRRQLVRLDCKEGEFFDGTKCQNFTVDGEGRKKISQPSQDFRK
jgi:hypothetical protein